jgi:geranylgeranyl diphosphate synthase type II
MNDSTCERRYRHLRDLIDRHLRTLVNREKPVNLARALRYVLHARGKRVRGALVVFSCEAVGGRATDAMQAGAAVEMMHNFTLVHDDIMDHAATRRGRPTVHTKWDQSIALLSGDVLLGMAYRSLLSTKTRCMPELVDLFTQGLLDVCDGQALDLEFEQRSRVTLQEYAGMIGKKTGALLAMSAAMGGVAGGGTRKEVRSLYQFGLHLGRAFQIQDDLLDVIAEQKEFGKRIGGDIIERKKTFLALTALKYARGKDRLRLRRIFKRRGRMQEDYRQVIAEATGIYRQYGVIDAARQQIARETHLAQRSLRALPRNNGSAMLLWFSGMLLQRTS